MLTQDGGDFLEVFNGEQIKGVCAPRWGVTLFPETELKYSELYNGWRCVKASLDVHVPAGCFAKPAPRWEQAWVNHWFRHAPLDECEYRKRRLWAYSIQPPVMFVNWLIRIGMTLLVVLTGFKIRNLQPIHSILSTNMGDVLDSIKNGNYFWPKSWGEHPIGYFARIGLPVFTPLSLSLIAIICSVVDAAFLPTFAVAILALYISTPLAAGLAAAGLFGTAHMLDWKEKRKSNVPVIRDYLQPNMVEYLSCETLAGQPRRFKNVPLKHRTVRLWYEDTKAKVCRPFAR